jgi:uncharacterized membrane protein
MNRTLTFLLMLSLAANVFLGGFVAGRLLGGPRHDGHVRGAGSGEHRGGPDGAAMLFGAMEDLSPAGREILRETFKGARERMRDGFGKSAQMRRALGAALAAEPFDRAKAEAALALITEADAKAHLAASTLLIDAAEKMTPADRKALAEAYQRPRERWRRHGPVGPGHVSGDESGPPPE